MDLKSSESGLPQSSFLDLSGIKPGVLSQWNQTETFFFFETTNDTFTEASAWSPKRVPFRCWSQELPCLPRHLHTWLAHAFNLLLLVGQLFSWSDCPLITRAPVKRHMFYFWFPGKAERGVFGVPCTDWCFPKVLVCSLCLEGQGWWWPGESGTVLIAAFLIVYLPSNNIE